ncbi:hypothetical protein YC2023_019209 [Brassica napus]
MGNSLGGKKTTKVMKIDDEAFKLRTAMTAEKIFIKASEFHGETRSPLLEVEPLKTYMYTCIDCFIHVFPTFLHFVVHKEQIILRESS